MEDAWLEERLERLEQQIDILTRAVHLLTVSSAPTSKWLEASMSKTAFRGNWPGQVRE